VGEYVKNLQVCIDQRLQDFAMSEGFSIIDLHIFYHHQISIVSDIYRIPSQHYSKVLAVAYNNTISKIYKRKE
jgi:hypothetical protein